MPPDESFLAEDQFLTVRIGGDPGRAERLLLIGRPIDGEVRVREWSSDSWNTEGEDHDVEPALILAEIETCYAGGIPVRPEMHRIRQWLGGLL